MQTEGVSHRNYDTPPVTACAVPAPSGRGPGLLLTVLLMKKLFLSLIRFYQRHISPNTPPSCRFYPTCSSYAYEAIQKYGALKGGLMALWRLLRCNPFNKSDPYDPVP